MNAVRLESLVRSKVLTAMKMLMLFFWVVTSTLKIETPRFSETLATTDIITYGSKILALELTCLAKRHRL